MAIKDWKKIQEGMWLRYDEEKTIHLQQTNDHRGKFVITIGGKHATFLNMMKSTKFFKTKAKALKYAKSYMRKH